MVTTGLEVRLHEGRERAEVVGFTGTLNQIVRALREIDQIYLSRGARPRWIVTDLSREGRDMVVKLEAGPSSSQRSAEDMLLPARAFVQGAELLNRVAEVPMYFTPTTVKRMADLAEPRGGVQTISVALRNGTTGPQIDLSDAVHNHAREAIRAHEISYGSVVGVLDGLAANRRQPGATLVTIRTSRNEVVAGNVAENIAEQLRALWQHRVIAGGKVWRNGRGQAIRIEIEQIELMPEGDLGRPSTKALLGIVPDWTGGQDVDAYVRDMRRE